MTISLPTGPEPIGSTALRNLRKALTEYRNAPGPETAEALAKAAKACGISGLFVDPIDEESLQALERFVDGLLEKLKRQKARDKGTDRAG